MGEIIPPQESVAQAIQDLLEAVNVDFADPNYADTPNRVAKAYTSTWLSGYGSEPEDVLTVFPNEGREDGIVLVKDIPFYSTCSHHLCPFFGKAHIAYIPDESVIGLSKFARLVDVYARRFQLQERIGQQVADAVMKLMKPKGAMVILANVEHTCMTSRGVKAHGSSTTTSEVRGVFRTDPAARAEVLSLLQV